MGLFLNNDILLLAPMAILSFAGLYVLFADLFKSSSFLENALFAIALIVCAFTAFVCILGLKNPGELFSRSMFINDPMGAVLSVAVISTLALTILISRGFLGRLNYRHGEYYSLLFFSVLGMLLLLYSNSLLIVFLGLEIMSLPLYILSGFLKEDARSKEAAMKYFILGAFSTGIFAMGVALVYGATGSLLLNEIFLGVSQNAMRMTGLALMIIGLGFKVAFVPFHMWVPDVYEGAPTPLVAFMSVSVKVAVFAAFLRIFVLSMGYTATLMTIMKVVAVISMTWGNIAAIYQDNMKRMLAYSSIAHAGYILIAIIAANQFFLGIGVSAFLFYLIVYALMKFGAFATVAYFEGREGKTSVKDYAGLGFKHPFIGLAMSVFMLSLAGIPLTAGFMGKLYVFGVAVQAGLLNLAIIGVINSLLSVYYYLRVIVYMYMRKSENAYSPRTDLPSVIVIGLLMALVLLLGIYPKLLLSLTEYMTILY